MVLPACLPERDGSEEMWACYLLYHPHRLQYDNPSFLLLGSKSIDPRSIIFANPLGSL